MPILVTCRCGKSYNLKDEMAGKLVRGPSCGQDTRVPEAVAVQPAFDRGKLLVRPARGDREGG